MPNAAPRSAETGDQPACKERMAVALARDIVDGERVISGPHTEISFAAAMLAQKMHAPNIKLQLGGTCFLVNVTDLPVRLPKTSTEYRMIRWAEIAYDHMETFMYFGAPGGRATTQVDVHKRTNISSVTNSLPEAFRSMATAMPT